MANKKSGSCLGLFIKSSFITSLITLNLAVVFVIIAVKFMGADANLWTDFSHWNNRPWILVYCCLGIGGALGIVVSLMASVVSALFGKSEKKSGQSAPKKSSRPQSNRKTTI